MSSTLVKEPPTAYPCIDESDRLWERARPLIPAGTQTLAKGPSQHVRGVAPKYLVRGSGAHVTDADGNEYLDLVMGVGPLVLGYAYPRVDAAIRSQLADGITFSLMHPLEVEVAELVSGMVPGAESVRFSKTGADVVSAAVRLARAFTGRDHVLCCGYHGWHDWYVSSTDRSRGIPRAVQELTSTVPYGDLGAVVERLDDSVACVVLEPMTFDPPPDGFLEGLRELCDRRGALLVFDEMWTGFRVAQGGAQELFGVTADLATFSKALANGMPLSALTGRRDVMSLLEHDVFFFTTFGGEALSLAAAKATLLEIQARGVPEALARLGRRLKTGFNDLARDTGLSETVRCVGLPCRTLVRFDPRVVSPLLARSFAQQELLRHGVLWNGGHTLSYSHTDADVDDLLVAWADVLERLRDAIRSGELASRLRGAPVEPLFRRTTDFDTKPPARTR